MRISLSNFRLIHQVLIQFLEKHIDYFNVGDHKWHLISYIIHNISSHKIYLFKLQIKSKNLKVKGHKNSKDTKV